ncbi:MAG: hypothetical protein ACI952_000959 [Flavobacteriales bacterium]|jgi:hypothetical protein
MRQYIKQVKVYTRQQLLALQQVNKASSSC